MLDLKICVPHPSFIFVKAFHFTTPSLNGGNYTVLLCKILCSLLKDYKFLASEISHAVAAFHWSCNSGSSHPLFLSADEIS